MEKEEEQVQTKASASLELVELPGLGQTLTVPTEIVPIVMAVDNSCLKIVQAAEMMGVSLVKAQKVLAMRPAGWDSGPTEAKNLWTAVTNSVYLTYKGNLGVMQAQYDFLVEFSNLYGAAQKSVTLLSKGSAYDLACIDFVDAVDSFSKYRETLDINVSAFVKAMDATMKTLMHELPGRDSLKNATVGYEEHLQKMNLASLKIAEIEANHMPEIISLIREIEGRKGQKAILKASLREAANDVEDARGKVGNAGNILESKRKENIETNAQDSFFIFRWDSHRKAETARAAREAEAYKNILAAELERETGRRDELAKERNRVKMDLKANREELARRQKQLQAETQEFRERYDRAKENYQKAKEDILATLNKTLLHEEAAANFIERGHDMLDQCADASLAAVIINSGMKSLANELQRNTGVPTVLKALQKMQFPLPELCAAAFETEGILLITDINLLTDEALAGVLFDYLKNRPAEETVGVITPARVTLGMMNRLRNLLQAAPGYVDAQRKSGQDFLEAFTGFLRGTKPVFQKRLENNLLECKQRQVKQLTN